jgi:ubiquinone biosynthesis protein COQ4
MSNVQTLTPASSMSKFASFRRMVRLVPRVHEMSGDIAVHKADLFLARMTASQREQLSTLDPLIPAIDMAELRGLPQGSFGRAYASFLDDNELGPFTLSAEMPAEVVARNAHWARYALVHDMLHVLLGFGPDLAGEMGVYAFTLAQRLSWVFWMYLPLAWLVMPILAPHRIPRMIRNFRRGYRLGRALDNQIALALDRRFAQPIEQVRAELGYPREAGLRA